MTLNEVFLKIPPKEARGLFKKVEDAAMAAGLTYQDDDGTERPTPILIRPRIIRPEQEAYFHGVCEALTASVEELTRVYQENKRVRALLPFTEGEERWLGDIRKKVGKQPQTVVARIDANVDFAATDWKTSFNFFETNSVGVGGMYMAPTCAQILRTIVMPVMQRYAPSLVVKDEFDTRQLLLEQMTSHAKVTKKRRINTAFVQEKDLVGGAGEFPHFVEYFKSKGIPAVHADPRELRVKGEEIFAGDLPIDVIYRDSEISGFIELEDEGHDVTGMKTAFMRNHLSAWDAAIGDALKEPLEETGGTVAQRYVEVRTKDFPVLTEDGIALEEFYVVAGFLSTPRGLGILGRASKKRVVNVGQRGGLTAVLVLV